MSREIASFLLAMVGLALIVIAVLIALYSIVTGSVDIPPDLLPFVPMIAGAFAFAGGWIVRAAYREATRAR
jgi:uncharacterized RDD family membrane protein YckC